MGPRQSLDQLPPGVLAQVEAQPVVSLREGEAQQLDFPSLAQIDRAGVRAAGTGGPLELEAGSFQQHTGVVVDLTSFGRRPGEVHVVVRVPIPCRRILTPAHAEVVGVVQPDVEGGRAVRPALVYPHLLSLVASQHRLDQGEQPVVGDVQTVVVHDVGNPDVVERLPDVVDGEHPHVFLDHRRLQFGEQAPRAAPGPEAHRPGQED
jgi:hypothetical protein